MKNKSVEENFALGQRVPQLGECLLGLRKAQDQAGAVMLASLGNLSLQELNVLNIIGDSSPAIMSDIAKSASLSLSSVTVIVEKLVKKKLVERVRDASDRRIVKGILTAEGSIIHATQIEHMHLTLHKMLSLLSDEEQENFITTIQKITRAWD